MKLRRKSSGAARGAWLRCLLAVFVVVLNACGGGGSSGGSSGGTSAATAGVSGDPDRVGRGWIITETSKLFASTLTVEGRTFVTARYPDCCALSEGDATVQIAWANSTAGTSGFGRVFPAYVNIFGVLDREKTRQSWTANITLVPGENKITVTASDAAGNFGRVEFTTVGDATPPTITGTSPADGSTSVDAASVVVITFSERMAEASISAATVRVEDAAHRSIAGGVTYADSAATFSPVGNLAPLMKYVVTVSGDVTDATGNRLGSDRVFSFETRSADFVAPSVSGTWPVDGATCVAREGPVEVGFSEPVAADSVTAATFSLHDIAGQSVAGSIDVDGSAARFRPTSLLAASSGYVGVLTTGVRDRSGNRLAADYTWSFTTAAAGPGSWRASAVLDAPAPRRAHAGIWTGTDLIVWGGLDASSQALGDGARYRPATDSWLPVASAGAPAPRWQSLAAWTGSRMLVWGGSDSNASPLGTGGSYDPLTDTWAGITLAGAPAAREYATAVWTGTEFIVWGGRVAGRESADGARYLPATDSWLPVSNVGAPSARSSHVAVWTGTRMIVWGGTTGYASLASGASYDPATDSWTPLPIDSSTPSPRFGATAVWTGTEVIVWGGVTGSGGAGARFNPTTDSWRSVSTRCASGGTAVWSGREMIVWGSGFLGARYDPNTDIWEPVSTIGAPQSRSEHAATWANGELIVWGGDVAPGGVSNSGGRYQPY